MLHFALSSRHDDAFTRSLSHFPGYRHRDTYTLSFVENIFMYKRCPSQVAVATCCYAGNIASCNSNIIIDVK